MMKPSFWQNKKVFITGHTGFKGGWLCLLLQQWGASLHGYALNPPTSPNLFTTAKIRDFIDSHVVADVRDLASLKTAMERAQPDIVLHLAAQPLLRPSYAYPVETYATNVMGTVHVLEAARHISGLGVVVNVTTDKCYENTETPRPYREQDPMGGFDPYSSSKGCSELVTAAYGRSFFANSTTSIATARAGNVIGGGDWSPERLMTDILAALSEGGRPLIRNPASVRPWQHVLEPLSGYLCAAEYLWNVKPSLPQAWNFGPDEESEVSVAAVADQACQLWGQTKGIQLAEDAHAPHEAGLLKLDSTKARQELGWRPRWKLADALGMTIAWHKAFQTDADMQKFSLQQIAAYTQTEHPHV